MGPVTILTVFASPCGAYNLLCSALCSSSQALAAAHPPLKSFRALRTVHITFFGQTLATQHRAIQVLNTLPSELTELHLSDLADINIYTLSTVASNFPRLTSLTLTCSERLDESCCWSCFEESASCTWHSLIPERFCDVADLTVSGALRLFLLTSLDLLYIL